MSVLLFASAASAAITGALGDIGTAAVLVGLVALNTLIGFVQEYRAEKTIEALERLVAPTSEVYRDGELVEVQSKSLVVGDIVRLAEGVSVPADVRLIHTTAFSTNEFALTGESDPTRKNSNSIPHGVLVADRHNMAFAGTTVATGRTLGATHVICTDKTDTLTRNEMTVTELVVGTATADTDHRLRDFLAAGVLASNARLVPPAGDIPHWHVVGDPTEGALLVVASKAGLDRAAMLVGAVEIGELPFDSTRKLMTSMRRDAEAASNDLAVIEKDLTMLGLVPMIDPIRSTVLEAMADVIAAGVKVDIITGDFSLTAAAIVRQAGLAGDDGLLAITGDGINDAPALRHANIGVAMGEAGTDAAKQAAEIVLLDDSLATLVGAVRQGHTIYRNIS